MSYISFEDAVGQFSKSVFPVVPGASQAHMFAYLHSGLVESNINGVRIGEENG